MPAISLFCMNFKKKSFLLHTEKEEKNAHFLQTSYPETDEKVRYLGELFIFYSNPPSQIYLFLFLFFATYDSLFLFLTF